MLLGGTGVVFLCAPLEGTRSAALWVRVTAAHPNPLCMQAQAGAGAHALDLFVF